MDSAEGNEHSSLGLPENTLLVPEIGLDDVNEFAGTIHQLIGETEQGSSHTSSIVKMFMQLALHPEIKKRVIIKENNSGIETGDEVESERVGGKVVKITGDGFTIQIELFDAVREINSDTVELNVNFSLPDNHNKTGLDDGGNEPTSTASLLLDPITGKHTNEWALQFSRQPGKNSVMSVVSRENDRDVYVPITPDKRLISQFGKFTSTILASIPRGSK